MMTFSVNRNPNSEMRSAQLVFPQLWVDMEGMVSAMIPAKPAYKDCLNTTDLAWRTLEHRAAPHCHESCLRAQCEIFSAPKAYFDIEHTERVLTEIDIYTSSHYHTYSSPGNINYSRACNSSLQLLLKSDVQDRRDLNVRVELTEPCVCHVCQSQSQLRPALCFQPFSVVENGWNGKEEWCTSAYLTSFPSLYYPIAQITDVKLLPRTGSLQVKKLHVVLTALSETESSFFNTVGFTESTVNREKASLRSSTTIAVGP